MRTTVKDAHQGFTKHLNASTKSESTVTNYHSSTLAFKNYCDDRGRSYLDEITPSFCVEFLRRRECRPGTLRSEITRIGCMLDRCVENQELSFNPFKHSDVRSIKPDSYWRELHFTEEQMNKFSQEGRQRAASAEVRHKYIDFFILLSETGMRLAEGRHLRYCDVHKTEGSEYYIKIEPREGWQPKSIHGIRAIPLTMRAKQILLYPPIYHSSKEDSIFPMSWSNRSVNREFNLILKHLGWHERNSKGEKYVVHSLRHTFATRLLATAAKKQMPLSTVRDILGHGSFRSLDIYWHATREESFELMRGM